ncbi:MAG: hypothetical protein SGPRY_003626 [Prymnesium sp.]
MPTKADALACNGLLTLRQCTALLKPLHKMEAAFAFRMPVDPEALNLPDYHTVIKRPMDLGTIQEKLDKAKYDLVSDFILDCRLVWENAKTYNPVNHWVHQVWSDFFLQNPTA